MNRLTLFLLTTTLLVACTESAERDKDIDQLHSKIQTMEKSLDEMEGRLRDAGNDPGLRNSLLGEQALMKSRLERLKQQAKK